MTFYCLEEFFHTFKKLKKNNSYKDIEKALIKGLLTKSVDHITKGGVCLNGNRERPLVKSRPNGSSGYRVIYLTIVCDDKVYMGSIYSHKGSKGIKDISDSKLKDVYAQLIDAAAGKIPIYEVSFEGNELNFEFITP